MKPAQRRKLIAERRRGLAHDDRLDWRDPQMPVLRDYRFGNGSRKTIVDPEYESRYREMLVASSPHIPWNCDPTYNMRRKS